MSDLLRDRLLQPWASDRHVRAAGPERPLAQASYKPQQFTYILMPCWVLTLLASSLTMPMQVRGQAVAVEVQPGINDRFVDPELDVNEWLARFEIESREVYSGRKEVLKACGIEPGLRVADVGAGTGLYTQLFAETVGQDGWVFAVDISPRFLEHINERSQAEHLENVTSVLGSAASIKLPPNSIDLAFICDTYHHFERPQSTLASIHRALKPGGRLIVIDFERIPGKSREFIIGHVRAGKEVFRDEIVAAGFALTREIVLPELKENYFLRFRKE